MIRGKKNYLPTCQLQLGFGIMFKLDDESIERHKALQAQREEATSVTNEGEDEASQSTSDADEKDDEKAEGFPDVEVRNL